MQYLLVLNRVSFAAAAQVHIFCIKNSGACLVLQVYNWVRYTICFTLVHAWFCYHKWLFLSFLSLHYGAFMSLCQLCSPETLKTIFHVELDAAKATWLSHDIVMFSSKNGEILLLTVVYDGRYDTIAYYLYKCSTLYIDHCLLFWIYRAVQRLDLMKSKASILSSVSYLCTCFAHRDYSCTIYYSTEG
jgi:hypothetical protein